MFVLAACSPNRKAKSTFLLAAFCVLLWQARVTQSAPWFSSFSGEPTKEKAVVDEEDLKSLVSPIVNRQLETSVVAHTWPSNPQNVFCEAYAYHQTTYSNDGPRQELTKEEEAAAVALNHEFLNSLSDKLLEKSDGDNSLSFDTYTSAKEFVLEASSHLAPSSKSLMEYSLAMRVYSPQCELHRGLARQKLQQLKALTAFRDQNVFAVVYPGGNLVPEEQITSEDYTSFSHDIITDSDDDDLLLPGEFPFGQPKDDAASQQLVFLYANIGTVAFAKAYKKLYEDSQQKNIRFVVRHLGAVHFEETGPTALTKPTILQGYGVRLDIRNVEYKVFDDRKTEGSASDDDVGLMNLTALDKNLKAPPQYLAGVNFSALGLDNDNDGGVDGESDNNATDILKELWKKHEAQQAQLIPPTWQRRKLSLQAASVIAKSKDPIMTLEEVSLNLPSVASMLVHAKIPQEIQEMAEKFEEDLSGILPSSGALFINGRRVNIDRATFNVFELLNMLRKEQAALKGLQTKLGPYLKSPKTMNIVKQVWTMGEDFLRLNRAEDAEQGEEKESKVFRIDVGRGWKKAVIYLNDVEKDEKYAQWPRSVRQVFMAMQFGMPPSIRRNLFTILAVLDPIVGTENVGVALGKQLMQSSYPARLGVLLVGEDDVVACADWVAAHPESKDGEPCPVASDPLIDNGNDKEKLKKIPGSARAFHRLFADLVSRYPSDLADAYLEYVLAAIERKKEMLDDEKLTLNDVVQIHVETMDGMQMGSSSQHWTAALSLLSESEDDDEDDSTQPTYAKALRFAVDKGLKVGMSFVNGRPLPVGEASEVFEKAGSIFNEELGNLFGLIQKGVIKDHTPRSVYGSLLTGKGVFKKVHPLLMGTKDKAESYVSVPHEFDSKSLLFPSAISEIVEAVFVLDAVLDIDSMQGLQLAKSLVSVMDSFPASIAGVGEDTVGVKIGYRIIPSKATETSQALCPVLINAGELGAKKVESVLELAVSKSGESFTAGDVLTWLSDVDEDLKGRLEAGLTEGPCSKLASFDISVGSNLIVSNGLYYALEGNYITNDDIELLLSLDIDYTKAVTALLGEEVAVSSPDGCDAVARTTQFLAMEAASAQFDRIGLLDEIVALEKKLGVDENPLRFSWNSADSEELQVSNGTQAS
jgi:hypothetical protein